MTLSRMKRDAEYKPQAIDFSSRRQLPVRQALNARILTLLHEKISILLIIILFPAVVNILLAFFIIAESPTTR